MQQSNQSIHSLLQSSFYSNFKPLPYYIQQNYSIQNHQSNQNKHILRPKIKYIRIYSKNQFYQQNKNGHWSLQQNKRYYIFLKANKQLFLQKSLRRTQKIFKFMSKYLVTRSAAQCRSHHQKIQKKCESFEKILEYLLQVCKNVLLSEQSLKQQCLKVVNECKLQNESDQQIKVQMNLDTSINDGISYEMPKQYEPCYMIKQKSERESTNEQNQNR